MAAVMHDFAINDTRLFNEPAFVSEFFEKPSDRVHLGATNHNARVLVSDVYMFTQDLLGTFGTLSSTRLSAGATWNIFDAQALIEQARLSTAWKSKVANPDTPTDIDSLSETIECVYELLGRWGTGSIQMTSLPNYVNGEHAAAVLRVTFDFRHQIEGWDLLLDNTIDSLKKANLDHEDALWGLI